MIDKTRMIVPYIRRDDISWWAGCRWTPSSVFDPEYIREESTLTKTGAKWRARRLAKKARKLRAKGLAGFKTDVGPAR